MCECLGAAQTITTSPLGARSKKPSQCGRRPLQGSVHGRTGKRFCHGGHLVSTNKGLFVFVSGLCRANVVSRRHMFALSCVCFKHGLIATMTPKQTAVQIVLVKAFPAMSLTTSDRFSDWHHDSRTGNTRPYALQSSHLTCAQRALLAPPVQA